MGQLLHTCAKKTCACKQLYKHAKTCACKPYIEMRLQAIRGCEILWGSQVFLSAIFVGQAYLCFQEHSHVWLFSSHAQRCGCRPCVQMCLEATHRNYVCGPCKDMCLQAIRRDALAGHAWMCVERACTSILFEPMRKHVFVDRAYTCVWKPFIGVLLVDLAPKGKP